MAPFSFRNELWGIKPVVGLCGRYYAPCGTTSAGVCHIGANSSKNSYVVKGEVSITYLIRDSSCFEFLGTLGGAVWGV